MGHDDPGVNRFFRSVSSTHLPWTSGNRRPPPRRRSGSTAARESSADPRTPSARIRIVSPSWEVGPTSRVQVNDDTWRHRVGGQEHWPVIVRDAPSNGSAQCSAGRRPPIAFSSMRRRISRARWCLRSRAASWTRSAPVGAVPEPEHGGARRRPSPRDIMTILHAVRHLACSMNTDGPVDRREPAIRCGRQLHVSTDGNRSRAHVARRCYYITRHEECVGVEHILQNFVAVR